MLPSRGHPPASMNCSAAQGNLGFRALLRLLSAGVGAGSCDWSPRDLGGTVQLLRLRSPRKALSSANPGRIAYLESRKVEAWLLRIFDCMICGFVRISSLHRIVFHDSILPCGAKCIWGTRSSWRINRALQQRSQVVVPVQQ